jgi:hypothetical protein
MAVVCSDAGTIAAHSFTALVSLSMYSERRANANTTVLGSPLAGRHAVQLKSGTRSMESSTGSSVATPAR